MVNFIWKVWVASDLGQTGTWLSCILGDLESHPNPAECEKLNQIPTFYMQDMVHSWEALGTPHASRIKTKVLLACLQSKWTGYPRPVKTLTTNIGLTHLVPSPDFSARSGCYIFLAPLPLSKHLLEVWGTSLPWCILQWLIISGTKEPANSSWVCTVLMASSSKGSHKQMCSQILWLSAKHSCFKHWNRRPLICQNYKTYWF